MYKNKQQDGDEINVSSNLKSENLSHQLISFFSRKNNLCKFILKNIDD